MDTEIKTALEALQFVYSSIYQPGTETRFRYLAALGACEAFQNAKTERARVVAFAAANEAVCLALQAMEQQQEEDYDVEIEM